MADQENLSHEASTHTSGSYQDLPYPFTSTIVRLASGYGDSLQDDAGNIQHRQPSSLLPDHKTSLVHDSLPAARNKEDFQSSSDDASMYTDNYRDTTAGPTPLIPLHRHVAGATSARPSFDTNASFQTSALVVSRLHTEFDDAPATDSQLKASGRVPSVKHALDQPARSRTSQTSLRSKLSRIFGSRRKSRAERPKSLNHLASGPEAVGTKNHLQTLPAASTSQTQYIQTIKHPAPAPAVSYLAKPRPRFIGLQDRLAKEPVAVPTSVRRVDFQLPTDLTMATRGSSSEGLRMGNIPLGNQGLDKIRTGSYPDSQASTRTLHGHKQRRGIWARIKGKAKKVFGRGMVV